LAAVQKSGGFWGDFGRSVITLDHADFQRAAALCDQWQLGLRAGDALHVAIAERRDLTVCTLDRIMRETAVSLGMSVETP